MSKFDLPNQPSDDQLEAEQQSEILPNIRQQDKILAVLRTGDFKLLAEPQVSLTTAERESIIKEIAEKSIDERMHELLTKIYVDVADPKNEAAAIRAFKQVQTDKSMRGIIADLVRGDFEQRDSLDADDIKLLIERFPDPKSLIDNVKGFLDVIEAANGHEKRLQYEEALQKLLPIVYKKRFDYWQQFGLLQDEAERLNKNPKKEFSERKELKPISLEKIDEAEARKILMQTEIHGDAFNGKTLTRDILLRNGLFPQFRVKIGESTIWLSSAPYQLSSERLAVIAYVQSENQIVARSFYLSNSSGLWRYLPAYTSREGYIDWFSKGYGEEAMNAPAELQQALSAISQSTSEILDVDDPDLILVGTARNYYYNNGTHQHEINVKPNELKGGFNSPDPLNKVEPEKMIFENPLNAPDFERKVAAWQQNSPLYGIITFEAFPSKDDKFKFIFCSDENGRAWVANIECSGEIQSVGVRKNWVSANSLTTPAFEYASQAGIYGNYDMHKGNYVDMYKNYISRIPVIQEYQRHKQKK